MTKAAPMIGRPPIIIVQVLEVIAAAGAAGITLAEISEALPHIDRRSAGSMLPRHQTRGEVFRHKRANQYPRWFATESGMLAYKAADPTPMGRSPKQQMVEAVRQFVTLAVNGQTVADMRAAMPTVSDKTAARALRRATLAWMTFPDQVKPFRYFATQAEADRSAVKRAAQGKPTKRIRIRHKAVRLATPGAPKPAAPRGPAHLPGHYLLTEKTRFIVVVPPPQPLYTNTHARW